MNKAIKLLTFSLSLAAALIGCGPHSGLDGYTYTSTFHPTENAIRNEFVFNGYTYYWHGISQEWTRYGNLFKTNESGAINAIARSKYDIAADLGLEGLTMQESFLNQLLKEPFATLESPSADALESALKDSNVLVLTSPASDLGKQLGKTYTPDNALQSLINDNIAKKDRVDAFILDNGKRKLFVISAADPAHGQKVRGLITSIATLLKTYDLRRGWFGAQTLFNSVTNTPGHPLEVIGKGMNEGNSWFVFDGYMEFLSKGQYQHWMEKAHLPVITDVGFPGRAPIFGCRDYDSLQVQSFFTHSSWVNYAHSKGGYAFRNVYDTTADTTHLNFDGYIATEGNKDQIDTMGRPFVSITGNLESGAVPCMVLFTKKGAPFTQKTMWQTILDGREVAVLDKGKMMGPALYRNALEMLLLDRVFLEEYFGDKVNIEAKTEGYDLKVTVKNAYSHDISGKLSIGLPPEMGLSGDSISTLEMPAGATKTLTFRLRPSKDAMDSTTPIALHYDWGSGSGKSTMTMLELPPAISVHQLLYGQAPGVSYPVTIHNFTGDSSFPVTVQVLDSNATGRVVFESKQTCSTPTGTFKDMAFDLQAPEGNYKVRVSALGVEAISQLGVRKAAGTATLKETDLNHDGIDEYVMENDSIRATLLTTGARVIEYIVKSKNDNVLFKLWPNLPTDDLRPFRKREFYPYGGFEDFLGQPSIETSKVYDAVVTKKEGDFVQVKMTADYYGNKIEKIFTLFGNSPLLEIRYALAFKNPELNMIGPQPMVALGKSHGPEDRFVFPEVGGMRYCTADLTRYFGRVIFLKEGWNAAYDTKENISFAGAFPVDQPIFLHMWMNHPSNPGSMYFYAELQPWIRIFQKSTMYFSYYLWAAPGPWENSVKALRDRDLITTRKTWPFIK